MHLLVQYRRRCPYPRSWARSRACRPVGCNPSSPPAWTRQQQRALLVPVPPRHVLRRRAVGHHPPVHL